MGIPRAFLVLQRFPALFSGGGLFWGIDVSSPVCLHALCCNGITSVVVIRTLENTKVQFSSLHSEGELATLCMPHTLQAHAVVASLEVEDGVGRQEVDGLVGREGARHLAQ